MWSDESKTKVNVLSSVQFCTVSVLSIIQVMAFRTKTLFKNRY